MEPGLTERIAMLPGGDGSLEFDPQAVRERFGGDDELVQETVLAYQEELPVMLARLQEHSDAARNGDHLQLAETAHWIKGGLTLLSAPRPTAKARELELAARAREDERCHRLAAELSELLQVLSRQLELLL